MDDLGTDTLFEMAGLRQQRTGLPFYVWISPKAGSKHDVRVKVSPSHRHEPDREAIVALRPTMRVVHGDLDRRSLSLLRQWVALNEEVILDFWNEAIDSEDMLERIRRIG